MPSNEVLALDTLKARVWKHLHDVFVRLPIGYFYKWEPRGDGTVTSTKSEGFRITPTGFNANEISITYGPSRTRREALIDPISAEWSVVLTFAQEVLSEEVNEGLARLATMHIPGSADLPPVRLQLNRVDFIHPPMQDPTHGSILRYNFTALIGRS